MKKLFVRRKEMIWQREIIFLSLFSFQNLCPYSKTCKIEELYIYICINDKLKTRTLRLSSKITRKYRAKR